MSIKEKLLSSILRPLCSPAKRVWRRLVCFLIAFVLGLLGYRFYKGKAPNLPQYQQKLLYVLACKNLVTPQVRKLLDPRSPKQSEASPWVECKRDALTIAVFKKNWVAYQRLLDADSNPCAPLSTGGCASSYLLMQSVLGHLPDALNPHLDLLKRVRNNDEVKALYAFSFPYNKDKPPVLKEQFRGNDRIIYNRLPACNPSLVWHKDRYIVLYRHMERAYKHPKQKRWTGSHLLQKKFATKAGSCALDRRFSLMSTPQRLKIHSSQFEVREAEDCRIFSLNNKLYTIYTRPTDVSENRSLQRHDMYLGELRPDPRGFVIVNVKKLFLTDRTKQECEKNWIPLVREGKLYLIYNLIPKVITLKVSLETGGCQTYSVTNIPLHARPLWGALRGGTPAVPLDNGRFLMVAHGLLNTALGERFYTMIPIIGQFQDNQFWITHIRHCPLLMNYHSMVFGWQIQFPAGLTRAPSGDLVLSFGVGDQESVFCVLDQKKLLSKMVSVSQ
jgi:hypothetical protein